jgi:hypothetical protein
MNEGAAFHYALPQNAVLVTGARVRIGDGPSLLFSDGLIGVVENGRFQWHGVSEIKAYERGYSDASEQVVRWREISHLESPFILEFPADGATFIGKDGSWFRIPGIVLPLTQLTPTSIRSTYHLTGRV